MAKAPRFIFLWHNDTTSLLLQNYDCGVKMTFKYPAATSQFAGNFLLFLIMQNGGREREEKQGLLSEITSEETETDSC